MTQSIIGTLDLSSILMPDHTAREGEKIGPPSIKTARSSPSDQAQRGEEKVSKPPRLVYNKERLEFLTKLSTELDSLAQDETRWQDYVDEAQEWDVVVGDGLVEDESA